MATADVRLPLVVVATIEPVDSDPLERLVNGTATVVDLRPRPDGAPAGGTTAVTGAARRVLEVAEVAGGELSGALLAAVLGDEVRADDVDAARDELVAAGLVRYADGHLAIAQHATATAVRALLTPQRLAELHGQIGRALRDGAGGVVDGRRVACHLLLGDGERDVAVEAARRAAVDGANRRLWRDAAECARAGAGYCPRRRSRGWRGGAGPPRRPCQSRGA